MTAFIVILAAILTYEFLVFAICQNRVVVEESNSENAVVPVHWGLRLGFGLSIALLTLIFALWGGLMFDQSDSYTSGLGLAMIGIPGLVLAAVAMLLSRDVISGRARRITLISLLIVIICFVAGYLMGPYIMTEVV